MSINSILSKELRKKKFSGLSEALIDKEITLFFKRNPKTLKELEEKKEKDLTRLSTFKLVIKEIKRNLHKTYGAFQAQKSNKRVKLLEKKDFVGVLKTNLSTKERLEFYDKLYKRIFTITGNPKNILDLGAGLNPLSFQFMNLAKLEYLAVEINNEDVQFLNSYFELMRPKGIIGKAIILDLADESALTELRKISNVDICFMFKLLESLELTKKKRYKIIEAVLTSIRSKWIVASFATKTLSQKRMRFKKRSWFEAMLNRLNFQHETIEFSNEIFYIIKNN